MSSTITFVPYHIHKNPKDVLTRLAGACREAGMDQIVRKGDLCAIKTHFGEQGLTSYLRPVYARTVARLCQDIGARPFFTDSNTLYRNQRHNAVDHLMLAAQHGFSVGSIGAPIIIADGLRGHAYQDVHFDGGQHFESVQVPDAIHDADCLVTLTHFTAHLASGFGATIKNLSMGCSNPQGKRRMHCHSKPTVDEDLCVACGECTQWCPTGAITIEDYAMINTEECMACGECTVVCPHEAVKIPWDENSSVLQEKMVEYAKAVCEQKKERLFFISALVDLTPHCDCMGQSEPAFMPDIGILIGTDPVAMDQAGLDFISGSIRWNGHEIVQGETSDPLHEIYPKIDWQVQTDYGQKIGLGSKEYELIVAR